MEERRILTLLEEETLSEKVKQYPILYDTKGIHNDTEKNVLYLATVL